MHTLPLDDASIDLVVTSPPYLNAIDYMRCSKFSLVWMGHGISDLRRLRSRSIGSEVGETASQQGPEVSRLVEKLKVVRELGPRDKGILVRYIRDMCRTVHEAVRTQAGRQGCIRSRREHCPRDIYSQLSDCVCCCGAIRAHSGEPKRAHAPCQSSIPSPTIRIRRHGHTEHANAERGSPFV